MLKFIRDSSFRKGKKTLFCFFLLTLFFVFLPKESISQSEKQIPKIARVLVKIDGQLNGKDMEQLIPIKAGETFSLKKINRSIKQIYQTGLFSDIQVMREGEQEIRLTFILTRKFFTRKINFQGKREISRKKLRDGIYSLAEGSSFSEEKLNKAVEELKRALSNEGYFLPEIEAFTKKDSETSSVDIFFNIQYGRRFIIREISFSEGVLLPEARLKQEMLNKEGEVYIPSVLEEDIQRLKALYNSMGYQRAEIKVEERKLDKDKGYVSLSLKITPYEKIEIVVRGAKVPLNLLKPIWEERIFEEWGLAEGEAKIIGYMRKKGYLFSSVSSSIEKEGNNLRIVYEVTPNEKLKIQDVSFQGLKYFTPSQLKDELGIGKKVPFLSWIDGERLFELPLEIVSLYKTRGFSDTRVDINFKRPAKKVEALFYIEEGDQEKIEKIYFEGANIFSREILLEEINSFEGGPFFQPNIQKDIEKLENAYLNKGFRGTEIKCRVERVSESLFSVTFDIDEGKKVKVEKIIITGNVVTRKNIILRELRIKEGDFARYERMRESKRRLERLGIFTKVGIEEIPLSPEKENLVINIREGKRNYAGLGLGLETMSELQTFAVWNSVIKPRGTAEYIRSNIFGSAAQISLVGQFGLKERRGVFSWEQPYFFGIQMRTYLNAWLEKEERKSFTYERQGVSLTSIKPASESLLFLTTLRWVRTNLVGLEISETEVDRQHRPFSATSISGSFIWDKRNDPINPEYGSFLSFVMEWAYPLFKAESNYLKSFIKYQHFIPIFPRFTFNATSRLGLGGGKRPIPIHERFFAGGSNSFRGEDFDELGPKDPNSQKPVGGEALLLLNFEMTFPLLWEIKNLYGAIFYDIGNVFDKAKHFNMASLQDALGLGIRYRTPLGPVRLEFGWNLDALKGEKKVFAFITIGNVF